MTMKTTRTLLISLCLMMPAVVGCSKPADNAPPKTETAAPGKTKGEAAKAPAEQTKAASGKVRIAAAANLKYALEAVKGAFAKSHPEIQLEITYGSSGNFFAQLSQQAPFDVFLSADSIYPQKLVDAKLAESTFVYAVGRIVLWVPKASAIDLTKAGMKAVEDPSVKKIAIANPKVAPYGQAAEQAMTHAGVYDAAKDRIVMGDNIGQAAQFVESGGADIGVLALSLAIAPELKEKGRYWEVPADTYEPINQGGVVLSHAAEPEAAKTFTAFLTGNEGRAVLSEYGYVAPGR